jgi:hypothetical protein
MTQEHPITPPPELVEQWMQVHTTKYDLARQAAQWGADQELEACCEWINSFQNKFVHAHDLRLVRRPKPPSLKEQALALVEQHEDGWRPSPKDWDTIRRALEQLPDNE